MASGFHCTVCGQQHPRGCTGHKKARDDDGKMLRGGDGNVVLLPCKASPLTGLDVCRMHGGAAKQAKAAGVTREAEKELRRAFGRLAEHSEPVVDPLRALQRLAGDLVAWKDFAAERIAQLEEVRTLDAKGSEQVHGLVQVWQNATAQCTATLEKMARLGIEERLAKIDEQMAETVMQAINAALGAAGVSGDAANAARTAAARHLRSVG